MKYIRTKDDVWKYDETEKRVYKDCVINGIKGTTELFGLNENMIIKQADTIEELCDCCSYETETTIDFAVARSWKLNNSKRKIYGCILTDKGIIRMAEMNEKGELELL